MYKTFAKIRHVLAIWLKDHFIACLNITMLESFFIFDGKFYEQCNGVAMVSPVGPTLANVFMCHLKTFG